jgi:hypothetical protein
VKKPLNLPKEVRRKKRNHLHKSKERRQNK